MKRERELQWRALFDRPVDETQKTIVTSSPIRAGTEARLEPEGRAVLAWTTARARACVVLVELGGHVALVLVRRTRVAAELLLDPLAERRLAVEVGRIAHRVGNDQPVAHRPAPLTSGLGGAPGTGRPGAALDCPAELDQPVHVLGDEAKASAWDEPDRRQPPRGDEPMDSLRRDAE